MAAAPAAGRLSSAGLRSCSACLLRHGYKTSTATRLLTRTLTSSRKIHGGITYTETSSRIPTTNSQSFIQDYFSANTSIKRPWLKSGMLAAMRTLAEPTRDRRKEAEPRFSHWRTSTESEEQSTTSANPSNVADDLRGQANTPATFEINESVTTDDVLPHRKRKRRKTEASSPEESLPLDASSQLTTAAASMPASAYMRRRFATYLSLTKPRLSFLIILTTASSYSLYPIPDILSETASTASSSFSTSTLTLFFLTAGTFMSSACANTLNMLAEPKYDAMMSRTRNRPLVRKLISTRGAVLFALFCGTSGMLLLGFGTNGTVAALSALNIFLYAGVYTPMKRMSPANTWVGAVVGGIPPLMGWCAAAGEAATSEHHSWRDLLFSEGSLGGWALAALLFAWQFPHFMSLSHTIREDYRNAGHKMLAWTNPARNARVALRYSLAMFPICAALYWGGYVDSGFLVISSACNLWMTREAVRFWRHQGAQGSARGLFWASVWHLPLVLIGSLLCKRGLWDGVFGRDERVSIYQEQQVEEDGQALGMEEAKIRQRPHPPDINLAMMGFKRPT